MREPPRPRRPVAGGRNVVVSSSCFLVERGQGVLRFGSDGESPSSSPTSSSQFAKIDGRHSGEVLARSPLYVQFAPAQRRDGRACCQSASPCPLAQSITAQPALLCQWLKRQVPKGTSTIKMPHWSLREWWCLLHFSVVPVPFSNMSCMFHPCMCGNAIVGRFKYDLLPMQCWCT